MTDDCRLVYNPRVKHKEKKNLAVGVQVLRGIKAARDKLSGILRYAAAKPHWSIVILDGGEAGPVRLDARIVLTSRVLESSGDLDIPTVTVDLPHTGSRQQPSVFIDNSAIGREAAGLFIRRGLANLAAVRYTAGAEEFHSVQRIGAFTAAATKAGIPVSVYIPASDSESEFLCNSAAFRKWLLDLPKPCGIFCFQDRQARDVLDSCRLAQLSIPSQVSILGVDNETDVCEVTRPTLSSIQPDFEAAGHCAAKVLDALLSRRKVCETYPYGILRLVERESTRSMTAGGRIVSAAMRLIQSGDWKPTVAGLADRLHVSPSLLNIRFNEILGHGPKEEIDRQRLAQIEELFRDPSRSVAEVADLCRFACPDELYRFFRRRTGFTPSQWRKDRA